MSSSTELIIKALIAVDLQKALKAAGFETGEAFHPALQTFVDNIARSVHSAPPAQCRGITDSKCGYLAHCAGVCNKCGRQHDGQINRSAPWA